MAVVAHLGTLVQGFQFKQLVTIPNLQTDRLFILEIGYLS